MGPALWERAVKEERFQPVRGRQVERGLLHRGLVPRPGSTPQPETRICWRVEGLNTETPVSMLRYREDWGWLCGDTLREPGCGASHGGSAGRCLDPSEKQDAIAGERRRKCVQLPWELLFQGRAPLTLLHKFQVQLLLRSWTPEVAGTAALCPWEYA